MSRAASEAGVRSVVRLDADRETFAVELAAAARLDGELAADPGVQYAVATEIRIERIMARRRQGG